MSRLTDLDRLRWIHCLIRDEVREVYWQHQQPQSRQQVDGRNSTSRPPTYHEMITTSFNDETWEPATTAYAMLHNDYTVQIVLHKSEFEVTVEKSKNIMGDLRP